MSVSNPTSIIITGRSGETANSRKVDDAWRRQIITIIIMLTIITKIVIINNNNNNHNSDNDNVICKCIINAGQTKLLFTGFAEVVTVALVVVVVGV